MTRHAALLAAVILSAACGAVGTPPSSTASPVSSPVTSAKGAITVKAPRTNAVLTSPVTISGDASVFEANVQWRISDTGGKVIAEGFTTASQGAPGRGDFSVTATYAVPRETAAFVEVFSRSPKDGSIDELVRISVILR